MLEKSNFLFKVGKKQLLTTNSNNLKKLVSFISLYFNQNKSRRDQDAHQKLFNVLQIESHNTCTRKCWFCKFGQERQDPEIMFMTNETILKIAEDLQKLKYSGRISLYGINEPLLEPRLLDMITLFKSKCPDSFITINTNGDGLTEALYKKLILAGIDGIIIDIYDNLAMSRLRIFGAYEKVALKDMRKPIGKIDNRAGGIQINQDKFFPDKFIQSSCLRPFNMLHIRPNGDVNLCANDMYGDVVMGNVINQSLEDIWNSEKFKLYRNELNTNGRANLKLCQNCSHNGTTSKRNSYNLMYWNAKRKIMKFVKKLDKLNRV
jgi:radical SAM protein with 4Fe4S-binding SPASM domain